MNTATRLRDIALMYHRRLPERVRQYLMDRGIPDVLIHRYLLGWNRDRITVPIMNRQRQVVFFKLAKDPDDRTDAPKMLTTVGAKAELYGWERVLAKPERIVICEGEFDRLVLEAQGIAAVTSTAGAATFLPAWAELFEAIPHVYICFDNDTAGQKGAERVARHIPHSRIVQLPCEVGKSGDVTDFFVRLGRTEQDFERLLAQARSLPAEPTLRSPRASLPHQGSQTSETVEDLKSRVRIEILVGRYLPLSRSGDHLLGRCPFHEDHNPSFVVYPGSQSFYCFGCQAHGDVLSFLMRVEQVNFPEAIQVLQEI